MTDKPQYPELPEDPFDLETRHTEVGETQRNLASDIPTSASNATGFINAPSPPPQYPPPRHGSVEPPSRRAVRMENRGRARHRRSHGYAPPLWSIALMVMFVIVATGATVAAIIGLGGKTAPEEQPIIIVISPVPTERPAEFPISPASPTIPPEVDPIGANMDDAGIVAPTQPFILSGPTLEAVVFTPTPRGITIGDSILVKDVGADQLNVRNEPGVIDTQVIFRADEGALFVIVAGPSQADGLTWWQIQDPNNATRTGWAASNYLILAP